MLFINLLTQLRNLLETVGGKSARNRKCQEMKPG